MSMMTGDLKSDFPEKQHSAGDDQSKKLPEEKDSNKNYLRCADAIEDNDLSTTDEVKHNGLSLPDTGQPLIDKLPISSSIVKKVPSKNVIAVCSALHSTDSDEIATLKKRALKLDTLDPLEKQKGSFVESNDDIELKFENVRVLEPVELAGFPNGASRKESIPSESFESPPFLSNRSIWSFSKLIQQDPSYWGSLEDALSSNRRSEPNKPVLLESGDSSFNSSSTEDGSIEFSQIQKSFHGNPFSPECDRPMQENRGCFTRKLEKLPKEDKEEVNKFLKGFSRSPLEWTSDTEESSYSEDSSIDEEKMSNATKMEDCRTSADEVMKERDVRVEYKLITDMNFEPNGLRGDERLDSNVKKNHLKKDIYLLSDAWIPLREKHSHNTDKNMNVQNDRGSIRQSQSPYASGNLQSLSAKEFQSRSLEHTPVNTNKSIVDLIENAGNSLQEDLRPVITVESTERPALCKSKVDQICEENDKDRELTMETTRLQKSEDISETGVSKNEIVFLRKAHGNSSMDYDFVHNADADKETQIVLSENDSVLVQKADQSVLTGVHSVHDQDQETISYVPTIEGLVLEQCMASDFEKDNCRIEKSSEASSEEGSSAMAADLTAISSDNNCSSNCLTLNKTQTDSLPVALGTQVDPEHKAQMKESGMDLSNNTSKLLDTIGEETKSTDLAPIPFSGVNPFSAAITQSGSTPFSGSISLRSDSSNNSTRSFAFPILASEWNSSPVKMAPADHRYLHRKRQWRLCFCCTQPTTKI